MLKCGNTKGFPSVKTFFILCQSCKYLELEVSAKNEKEVDMLNQNIHPTVWSSPCVCVGSLLATWWTGVEHACGPYMPLFICVTLWFQKRYTPRLRVLNIVFCDSVFFFYYYFCFVCIARMTGIKPTLFCICSQRYLKCNTGSSRNYFFWSLWWIIESLCMSSPWLVLFPILTYPPWSLK